MAVNQFIFVFRSEICLHSFRKMTIGRSRRGGTGRLNLMVVLKYLCLSSACGVLLPLCAPCGCWVHTGVWGRCWRTGRSRCRPWEWKIRIRSAPRCRRGRHHRHFEAVESLVASCVLGLPLQATGKACVTGTPLYCMGGFVWGWHGSRTPLRRLVDLPGIEVRSY